MSEESKNQKGEANFNDSELQDIMAEIESLEEDFSSEESEAQASIEPVEVAEHAPEEEVFTESEDTAESFSGPVPHVEESNVSEITSSHKSSSESPMEFHGSGVLDFNMSFPVGDQKANVFVEDGQVKVVLGEVSFSISEEGCVATMAGGVQFSVPTPGKSNVKKAA
jgi:hypothetical protein